MKLHFLSKIKNWFRRQEDIRYFIVNVTPRALYEKRDVGGMRITLRFVKQIKRFGKLKTIERVETFNNYHDNTGQFTYNPPYVPNEDSHSEDKYWHMIGIWDDCERYPFARVTTKWLQTLIDDWAKQSNISLDGSWRK